MHLPSHPARPLLLSGCIVFLKQKCLAYTQRIPIIDYYPSIEIQHMLSIYQPATFPLENAALTCIAESSHAFVVVAHFDPSFS